MDIGSEIEIRERMSRQEQDMDSVHRRLDALESITQSIHSLAEEMRGMRVDLQGVHTDVSAMNDRIAEVESQPKKRYDVIVAAVISAAVAFVIGNFTKLF